MYNALKVKEALFGRVGWKQPTQPDYAIVSDNNQVSKSGRFFQDTYGAVSVQNVKDLMLDPDCSEAAFNDKLEALQVSAIHKTMSAIFTGSEVVDSGMTMLPIEGEAATAITNGSNFVGTKIVISRTHKYAMAIKRVFLYFDSTVTFTLGCYTDDKKTAIWEQEVTTVAGDVTAVDLDDLVLNYLADNVLASTFYIGYFQTDLGAAKAYSQPVESIGAGYTWRASFVSGAIEGDKFKTPTEIGSPSGLSFEVVTCLDHTSAIKANASLFDEAVSLQVACDVVELILTSTRSNATERISKELLADMFISLNQEQSTEDRPYGPGLKARYQREVQKLIKSFFGKPKIETSSLPYDVYQG